MTEQAHRSAEVKRSDARSYDATAAEFATLTNRYSGRVAARMLDLAAVSAGDRVLDVGTGTGLLARFAAARGAEAVGIDHSAGMLGQAQGEADGAGVGSRTQFLQMDAEALSFDDEAFDVCTSLYVLRHLPNPLAAAREMHRTLKSGGRLVVAIGARPGLFSTSAVDAAADRLRQALGRIALAPGSLRDFLRTQGLYLGHDHAAHSDPGDVGRMLRSAGFGKVRRHWLAERYSLTAEEFWLVQAVFDSDARAALTACGDAREEELKQRYVAVCNEALGRGRQLIYRTGALIFTATR
jgi:ubiquinone/menaquinone biosynthesis C-methylase UbiE